MRRPTNVTSWASAQRCQFPPMSAPQVGGPGRLASWVPAWKRVFKQTESSFDRLCWLKVLFPTEFSVLVDLSSDRTNQNLAAGDDDVTSFYQFAISSASTQPTDKGECTSDVCTNHCEFISQPDFIFGVKKNKRTLASTKEMKLGVMASVISWNYSLFPHK